MDTGTSFTFIEWRRLVADSFTNVEATFPAPDFTATARFQRVGDVELYDMETDPHTVIHSDRGNRTMCKFSLQLKGWQLSYRMTGPVR